MLKTLGCIPRTETIKLDLNIKNIFSIKDTALKDENTRHSDVHCNSITWMAEARGSQV
jgi:hypothetical protein